MPIAPPAARPSAAPAIVIPVRTNSDRSSGDSPTAGNTGIQTIRRTQASVRRRLMSTDDVTSSAPLSSRNTDRRAGVGGSIASCVPPGGDRSEGSAWTSCIGHLEPDPPGDGLVSNGGCDLDLVVARFGVGADAPGPADAAACVGDSRGEPLRRACSGSVAGRGSGPAIQQQDLANSRGDARSEPRRDLAGQPTASRLDAAIRPTGRHLPGVRSSRR